MNYILPIGVAVAFLGLFVAQIFALTTMRRLRKNPHRSSEFEAQDLFSGADIFAVAAAASMPKSWRDYNEKKGRPVLQEKYDWIMENTRLWERVLARASFLLNVLGVTLMLIGSAIHHISN